MATEKRKDRPWRVPNPEMARAMQELRRSSAASKHVSLPHKGARRARREQAIRDHLRED